MIYRRLFKKKLFQQDGESLHNSTEVRGLLNETMDSRFNRIDFIFSGLNATGFKFWDYLKQIVQYKRKFTCTKQLVIIVLRQH